MPCWRALSRCSGLICGWNDHPGWKIATTVYGGTVVAWAVIRIVRMFRRGVVATEEEYPAVQAGPDRNPLKDFLQPVSFLLFLVLSVAGWLEQEYAPDWMDYAILALLVALIPVNLIQYKKKKAGGR